jgi:hypothetical protein
MSNLVQIPIEVIKNIIAAIPLFKQLKEKHSTGRKQLLLDLDRFFDVFKKSAYYYDGNSNFEGKNVLELGYGNSLVIGLLFLAYGAEKVFW